MFYFVQPVSADRRSIGRPGQAWLNEHQGVIASAGKTRDAAATSLSAWARTRRRRTEEVALILSESSRAWSRLLVRAFSSVFALCVASRSSRN